jgi:hypothetical protein
MNAWIAEQSSISRNIATEHVKGDGEPRTRNSPSPWVKCFYNSSRTILTPSPIALSLVAATVRLM